MGSGVEAGSCSVRWKSFKFAQTTSAFIATDYTSDDPELNEALVCREAVSKLALLDVVSGVEVFLGKRVIISVKSKPVLVCFIFLSSL